MDRRLAYDLLVLAALAAGGALFYLASSPLLAGLGLLAFIALAWLRLDLAVLTVLVFVPYFMHPKHITVSRSFAPSELLLLAVTVMAAVISGLSLARRLPPQTNEEQTESAFQSFPWPTSRPVWNAVRTSPFVTPGIVFLCAALTSTAFAVEHQVALRSLRETVIEPLLFFALLLLFCGATSRRTRVRSRILMGIAVIATGMGPAVIGLGQHLTNSSDLVVVTSSYNAIRAWYGSRDNLGLLFDRTFPMAIAVMLTPLSFWRSDRRGNAATGTSARVAMTRVVLALAAAVMGGALLLTFSLGAWVATLIATLILLAVRFSWGKWLALGLVALVVLGALGSGRIGSAFTHVHGTTAARRIDVWRSSIRMLRGHPVVGIGPDNFLHYYAPVEQRGMSCTPGLGYMEPHDQTWREPCLSHPHNFILDFWLSTGILGLISFVWLQVVFWRIIWTRRSFLSSTDPVLLGAGGAMLAALIHGLVDNSYFLTDLSMITWFLFAIASSHGSDKDRQPLST